MLLPESPVISGVNKTHSCLVLQVGVRELFTFAKYGEHILETGEQVCVSGTE